MEEKTEEKMGFFKKWYTYQKERFPVGVYGLYIFCIVFAVFCYCNYMNKVEDIKYWLLIPI